MTPSPRAISALLSRDPMNPAAPVTNTRISVAPASESTAQCLRCILRVARCARKMVLCRTPHLARREYTPGHVEKSGVLYFQSESSKSHVDPACVHAGLNGV